LIPEQIKIMKIVSKTVAAITTETYEVEKDGQKYIYIDYLNDSGKVIDSILRDENGNNVDNMTLMEEIQELTE